MTKINDGGPDANGWLPVEDLPEPRDGDIHLFWDDILGVIHGRWCEFDDEFDAEWEFHTFDGDYLPDADPAFWFPLPNPPVERSKSQGQEQ